MTVDQYSNVETYEIAGSSSVRGGTKYTAYSGNSNLTYDFIQYPAGHAEFIFSLEDPDGQPQFENEMDCVKIG
ncbi:hypothetical protein S7335_498 [Synechococcus sp. PCC 7335]|nr:hypothetical protein S7335_498 [Synechococcus sp. PCC 7335]